MLTYCPQTIAQLTNLRASKGELFAKYPDTVDYALPQNWLNDFADFCRSRFPKVTYDLIRSTTVWAYPQNGYHGPVTCCREVMDAFKAWSE